MRNSGIYSDDTPGFWKIARSRAVVRRAISVASVVGTVLAVINHGDLIVQGHFGLTLAFKIALTFCVPYSVSTYSSVLAIREYSTRRRIEENAIVS